MMMKIKKTCFWFINFFKQLRTWLKTIDSACLSFSRHRVFSVATCFHVFRALKIIFISVARASEKLVDEQGESLWAISKDLHK